MCGIESMGLFQNGGKGCKESCGHAVCGRRGLESAGIVEEAGGPVRCSSPQAAEAPRPACCGRGNSKPCCPSGNPKLRGGFSRVRAAHPRRRMLVDYGEAHALAPPLRNFPFSPPELTW